jgi:hypothetical protein
MSGVNVNPKNQSEEKISKKKASKKKKKNARKLFESMEFSYYSS